MDWTDICAGYSNGHEAFNIAQDNLTKEQVTSAIKEVLGEDGWAADGEIYEEGVCFSTAKEDINEVAKKLSLIFPEATVIGQNCWDYEGDIVCYENGEKSTNYLASFLELVPNEEDNDYYEVLLSIVTNNGYTAFAGGGMVSAEEVEHMKNFIEAGNLEEKSLEADI